MKAPNATDFCGHDMGNDSTCLLPKGHQEPHRGPVMSDGTFAIAPNPRPTGFCGHRFAYADGDCECRLPAGHDGYHRGPLLHESATEAASIEPRSYHFGSSHQEWQGTDADTDDPARSVTLKASQWQRVLRAIEVAITNARNCDLDVTLAEREADRAAITEQLNHQ